MSMISSQIDELRKMAGKLESYDQGYGTICQALRDAADTIWQLRDDLQRANAENAKLRSELESVGTAAYLYGRTDLADENDKLREACAELLRMAERHDPEWLHWPEMHEELRKLGVKIVKL